MRNLHLDTDTHTYLSACTAITLNNILHIIYKTNNTEDLTEYSEDLLTGLNSTTFSRPLVSVSRKDKMPTVQHPE